MRIRVANRAGRLVAARRRRAVPTGISASDHHGASTASSVVPLAALTRARKSPMPSGMAKRSEHCERPVGTDEGRGDLRGCEADRLEHAVVADALTDREQGDRDERGGGDQQQRRVEGVDEERQLIRNVAHFARGPRVGVALTERDGHHGTGQCDRGREEERPAPSCEVGRDPGRVVNGRKDRVTARARRDFGGDELPARIASRTV